MNRKQQVVEAKSVIGYIRVSTEPLPRTESGKIFKRQLRETAIAELGL